MRARIILILGITFSQLLQNSFANKPDSVFLFAYATDKNQNHNGLHFAWSIDKETWSAIGPEHSFVKSDYGRWGSQKKMFSPFLFQDTGGIWHCVWSLNDTDGAIGYAASKDLVYWGPQAYPLLNEGGTCSNPEIRQTGKQFTILWTSKDGDTYQNNTSDFSTFIALQKTNALKTQKNQAVILGKTETGTLHKVPYAVLQNLQDAQKISGYKRSQEAERMALNPDLFQQPLTAKITPNFNAKKSISDMLLGVFFEDINYAADGGIYAELIQNKGFEYSLPDKEGRDKTWNSYKAWSTNGSNVTFTIDSTTPIHIHNKHYAALEIKKLGGGLINEGFDGVAVKEGDTYNFSVFARSSAKKKGKLRIRIVSKSGEILGETSTTTISSSWKKYEAVLIPTKTLADARIEISPLQTGRVDLDMISLFPQKTFHNRQNGLRADLAQVIADLKPRFVRFPGGCVAHGDGIANMYRWENTIGPLEARKPQRNMWGYHQTAGLGYFEYFQFCEDISAEPVPIVAAGVPCQNSAHHGCTLGGQQGGIPLEHMDEYVQSVLNLIEYANGDVKSEWGSKRAAAGHPKPFNLKYVGVGNEDLITDIFEERFKLIFDAVKAKYPEIMVIGTVGPFNEGTDYVEGWKLADKMAIPMVDEHYYQTPGWFLNNQDFYDAYDRSKSKVYLGEYAAHIPGRHNNLETALSEALHMINVERNGDVVSMTSYAPLLAKEGHTQWNPDLIYFNNTEVKPTVGYEVQKAFGLNSGNIYVPSSILNSDLQMTKRIASSFIKDGDDLILKLVNLMPVRVSSTIDLSNVKLSDTPARTWVLKGDLDSKTAKPEIGSTEINKEFNYSLPPYSFSVIRIKTK